MQAFGQMQLDEWRYVSAGALGNNPKDQAYADAVRRAATKSTATISTNVGRDDLRRLYGSAKIFWHAAGLGNPDSTPELNEHFGMTTVEAMASGCVPIVINKGGQPEIVEHGVSGFVWSSVDELQEYTTAIAQDPDLCQRMSTAARNRARQFDREHYLESFLSDRIQRPDPITRAASAVSTPERGSSFNVLLDGRHSRSALQAHERVL